MQGRKRKDPDTETENQKFTWEKGSKPSQKVIDEQEKRNQKQADREEEVRPDPEWIRLKEALRDACDEKNAAYNGFPLDKSPYDVYTGHLDIRVLEKKYKGSEAFTRYEKAYYEEEKYQNLLKRYRQTHYDIETNQLQNTTSVELEKKQDKLPPKDKQNAASTGELLDTKQKCRESNSSAPSVKDMIAFSGLYQEEPTKLEPNHSPENQFNPKPA